MSLFSFFIRSDRLITPFYFLMDSLMKCDRDVIFYSPQKKRAVTRIEKN